MTYTIIAKLIDNSVGLFFGFFALWMLWRILSKAQNDHRDALKDERVEHSKNIERIADTFSSGIDKLCTSQRQSSNDNCKIIVNAVNESKSEVLRAIRKMGE